MLLDSVVNKQNLREDTRVVRSCCRRAMGNRRRCAFVLKVKWQSDTPEFSGEAVVSMCD